MVKSLRQAKSRNRNRAALVELQGLGFSLPLIRKALIDLNEINVVALGQDRVSVPTLYKALKGESKNQVAQEILAGSLGLGRIDVFRGKESS